MTPDIVMPSANEVQDGKNKLSEILFSPAQHPGTIIRVPTPVATEPERPRTKSYRLVPRREALSAFCPWLLVAAYGRLTKVVSVTNMPHAYNMCLLYAQTTSSSLGWTGVN